MTIEPYHTPVLLQESVDRLIQDTNGIYVDATFGGGGHTREVLSRLGVNGKLIGFDQDQDAKENIPEDQRFHFIPANFRFVKNHLKFMGIDMVDGILADLGVSSHQFDLADRGFSIRSDAPLDMRMDRAAKLTAAKVVNTYSEIDLARIFWEYGELRESRKIASRIVASRTEAPIQTTGRLIELLLPLSHDPKQNRYLAKLFQALRIEVNAEMKALELLLGQAADVIKPGGRLVVIAYHSLEDRMVKSFMRSGNAEDKLEKDFFGNHIRPFTPMPGMPIVPTQMEIERNTRSRSAKLRVAIKNE